MQKFLIVLVLLILPACGLFGGFGSEIADCAEMGVKYEAPDYVDVVEESCAPGSGPGNVAYRALFKIPPSRLEEFQATTGLTEWTEDETQARIFTEEVDEFSSVLLATYADGAYRHEVLIDTSYSGDNAIFYWVHYYHAFVD